MSPEPSVENVTVEKYGVFETVDDTRHEMGESADPDLDRVDGKKAQHGRDHRDRLTEAMPVKTEPIDNPRHQRASTIRPAV